MHFIGGVLFLLVAAGGLYVTVAASGMIINEIYKLGKLGVNKFITSTPTTKIATLASGAAIGLGINLGWDVYKAKEEKVLAVIEAEKQQKAALLDARKKVAYNYAYTRFDQIDNLRELSGSASVKIIECFKDAGAKSYVYATVENFPEADPKLADKGRVNDNYAQSIGKSRYSFNNPCKDVFDKNATILEVSNAKKYGQLLADLSLVPVFGEGNSSTASVDSPVSYVLVARQTEQEDLSHQYKRMMPSYQR
jgi:hypothetical protein